MLSCLICLKHTTKPCLPPPCFCFDITHDILLASTINFLGPRVAQMMERAVQRDMRAKIDTAGTQVITATTHYAKTVVRDRVRINRAGQGMWMWAKATTKIATACAKTTKATTNYTIRVIRVRVLR